MHNSGVLDEFFNQNEIAALTWAILLCSNFKGLCNLTGGLCMNLYLSNLISFEMRKIELTQDKIRKDLTNLANI